MENLEKNQELQSNKDRANGRYSFYFSTTIIIVCMILAVASGMVSGWVFATQTTKSPNFVTIDILKLLEAQKVRLIEKYGSKEMTSAVQTEINKETGEFIENLKFAIAESSNGKIVIAKDVVIAGDIIKDITDDVAKKVHLHINNASIPNK